jgi:hypothetical protein
VYAMQQYALVYSIKINLSGLLLLILYRAELIDMANYSKFWANRKANFIAKNRNKRKH